VAYNAYPTDGDLVQFLSTMGMWNAAMAPLVSGQVQSAINKFEELTGRIPFLTESVSSLSYYDPPGSISKQYRNPWRGGGKTLELDTGFTQILRVQLAVSIDNPNGQDMDLNRQVRFGPLNYAARNLPIEWLDFTFPVWGVMGSVVVTGKRGYTSTLPADVWHAILQEAAAIFSPFLAAYQTGGANELEEADVHVKYSSSNSQGIYTGFLGDQANAWHTNFLSCVRRYTIIKLGLND